MTSEDKKGYIKCIFARLPCQGDILNKFKDVTHKFVCDIQTVLWLFAMKQTSDVVMIIFSGYLITKKDYLNIARIANAVQCHN